MKKHITALIICIIIGTLLTACGSLLDSAMDAGDGASSAGNGAQGGNAGKPGPGIDGDYTPFNLRWVDVENGIIAFDIPYASVDVDDYFYIAALYKDGVWVGAAGVNDSRPELTIELSMSGHMQEPGDYQFRVYAGNDMFDDSSVLGQIAFSETVTLKSNETPVDPNERGNSTSNAIGGGGAAIKDDWIYYVDSTDNGRSLFKVRADGTEEGLLVESVSGGVNVVGEWVYYADSSSGLGRIRTDSTDRAKVDVEGSILWGDLQVTVIGDWIYYQRHGDNENPEGFYKTSTSGGEQILLIEGNVYSVNVVGDRIYYIVYVTGDARGLAYDLYTMKTDGTEQSIIEPELFPEDNVNHVVWDGGYLYVETGSYDWDTNTDNYGIYRMDTDGQNVELIVPTGSPTGNRLRSGYNISDGWMYYVLDTSDDTGVRWHKTLYKTNIESRETVALTSGESDFYYANALVVGDWIYGRFTIPGDSSSTLHRIRTDGTGEQIVTH